MDLILNLLNPVHAFTKRGRADGVGKNVGGHSRGLFESAITQTDRGAEKTRKPQLTRPVVTPRIKLGQSICGVINQLETK
jgi:hypothetical protein